MKEIEKSIRITKDEMPEIEDGQMQFEIFPNAVIRITLTQLGAIDFGTRLTELLKAKFPERDKEIPAEAQVLSLIHI